MKKLDRKMGEFYIPSPPYRLNSITEFRNSRENRLPNFINYQVDFIKIIETKTKKDEINWENLIEHPTIKNNYVLNPSIHEHAKNFNLYVNREGHFILKFSIPYLLYGHNYKGINGKEVYDVVEKLKSWLNIDISCSRVLEFEYGMFEEIGIKSNQYISEIQEMICYDLEKHTPNFKMFGDNLLKKHYKIYDVIANSKSKRTYTKIKIDSRNVIKHELKFERVDKIYPNLSVNDFYSSELFLDEIKTELINNYKLLNFKKNPSFYISETDSSSILFTALKNVEQYLEQKSVLKLLYELIDCSDMSASQKSKKRKLFSKLNNSRQFNCPF